MLQIKIINKDGDPTDTNVLGARKLEFQIGRDPENDLVLNDPSVSRFHCKAVKIRDGHWELRDLSSRNGIFVLGDRRESVLLTPMAPQRIHLGEIELELRATSEDEDATKSIDMSELKKRSLRIDLQQPWKANVLRGVLGLCSVFLATIGSNQLRSDPRTIGQLMAFSAIGFLTSLIFIFVFAVFCKLNRGEYRFRQIYDAYFKLMFAFSIFELAIEPFHRLLVTAGQQRVVSLLGNCLGYGGLIFLMLREVFRDMRKRTAFAIVNLGVIAILAFTPLKNRLARSYMAEPDPVPMVGYPFIEFPKLEKVDSLLAAIAEQKSQIEEERLEHLKLR